jgi:hypothetical protein
MLLHEKGKYLQANISLFNMILKSWIKLPRRLQTAQEHLLPF